MVEVKVDVSELKVEGGDVIKELADFLREKTKASVETLADAISIEGDDISRKYLRVLLKKFLHQKELKDYYRVIGGAENSLIVKGRKIPEEEE
ncbi:MAG: 60S ribosomal protein L22 [Candidatus Bathyarchaeia archaeon]